MEIEDLKNIAITDKVLDELGFSEYWDRNGDSGDRTLRFRNLPYNEIFNGKEITLYKGYILVDIDEIKEDYDAGYPYGKIEKSPQKFKGGDSWADLITLYDIYEDIKEEDCKTEFLLLCDKIKTQ